MAYNFVDTPRTDMADLTRFDADALSFSMEQPFPSPSKDPKNDLVRQMKTRQGAAQSIKTPRARNNLVNARNGPSRNEFTPLLKSAAHNRFRSRENKENDNDLLNSVLSGRAPATPAYLKPGYVESHTPGLPVNSSMMDHDHTGSSQGEGTPVPPAIASSSIMSTPMPILPQRNGGLVDQGNVLTLREQEAVCTVVEVTLFCLLY